jgi:hypothetical protein
MSCNCTTPTYNCGNCGNTVPACTCSQTPILPPVYICPEPETCDEVFPLECVEYVGADIKCAAETDILHPAVEHYIVLEDGTTTERRLPSILNNINSQLCYIFTKEYISQVLTIIQADAELSALFCEIACSCNCEVTPPVGPTCLLDCPTHDLYFDVEAGYWKFEYSVQPDDPAYFPVTNYRISWYTLSGTIYSLVAFGNYDVATFPGPIETVPMPTLTDDTENVLVLVQILTENEVCTKGLPPSDGYIASDFEVGGAYYADPTVCWYKNNPATPIVCPTVDDLEITVTSS